LQAQLDEKIHLMSK